MSSVLSQSDELKMSKLRDCRQHPGARLQPSRRPARGKRRVAKAKDRQPSRRLHHLLQVTSQRRPSQRPHEHDHGRQHVCSQIGSTYMNAEGQAAACSMQWVVHYAVHRDGHNWKEALKLAKCRGATLRTEVASYIKEKPQHFKPFWLPPPEPLDETEKVNLEQMEGGSPPTTWESYLEALDRPARWADDLTFRP